MSRLMLRNLTNLLKAIQIVKETRGVKTRQRSLRAVHHYLTPFFFAVVWGKHVMQTLMTLSVCGECWGEETDPGEG